MGISRRELLLTGAGVGLGSLLLPALGSAQSGNTSPVSLLLGSHMDYLIALTSKYQALHGVEPKVELVTTPDLPVKLSSAFIARRSLGDAVFVDAATLAGLADKGWLTDVGDMVEAKFLPAGLLPNSLTAARYNGGIYGVPVTIGAPIMHWNKDLCEKAGLDPEAPSDWHSTPKSWSGSCATRKGYHERRRRHLRCGRQLGRNGQRLHLRFAAADAWRPLPGR